MKNNRKGFTLVELVIVITVIGILAAVLIPTFSTVINKANYTAAEQEAKSLRVGILVEYDKGTLEDYCKDLAGSEDKVEKKLTDKVYDKTGEDGAVFGDYVSELEENTKISINKDGTIAYKTKTGYSVKISDDNIEINKV